VRAAALDVRQPYYNLRADGVCEDLALAPTAATSRRIARCGFLWRSRRDGGDLLSPASPAEAAGEQALAELLRGPPLMFVLAISRPSFVSVTDVPAGFEHGRASLCISNRDSRPVAEPAAATAAIAAIVPHWERIVDLAAEPPAPGAWAGTPEAGPFLEEAARQAAVKGRLPFAMIALHLTAPDGENGGVFPISAGVPEPVRYRIEFEPRRTRWRYVVGTRGAAIQASTLAIGDGAGDPVRFTEDLPALGPLPRATATRAFISGEPIALAQRPLRTFYLEGRRSSAGRSPARLIDPLPAPPADAVLHRGAAGDAAAAVSEIYVYV
jgi:hypothetical protein